MCLFIEFIDFMLEGKKMTDFTSLFSAHDFDKNKNVFILNMNKIDKTNFPDQKNLDERK